MENIPVPPSEVNCGMNLIKSQQAVENALTIGSDAVLLRVNKIEDEIMSMNYSFIKEGRGM